MRNSGCVVTPLASDDSSTESDLTQVINLVQIVEMDDSMEYLRGLAHRDKAYPPCNDYLKLSRESSDSADAVSEAWRRKLCEWCYEVVDHYKFDREAVFIALNYLDRTVALKTESSSRPIQKREFQLIAVTSLYMALKIHGERDGDGIRRKLAIEAFVELSRGFFHVEAIEAMEREILASLQWRLNPPTCMQMIGSMLLLSPVWTVTEAYDSHGNTLGTVYDVARYLAELSVCVSTFAFSASASIISLASILCAIEAVEHKLPVPYHAQVALLNNITLSTGLSPHDAQVQQVCAMLKELAPTMFEAAEIPSEFLRGRDNHFAPFNEGLLIDGGNSSPKCVVKQSHAHEETRAATQRKRSRCS